MALHVLSAVRSPHIGGTQVEQDAGMQNQADHYMNTLQYLRPTLCA